MIELRDNQGHKVAIDPTQVSLIHEGFTEKNGPYDPNSCLIYINGMTVRIAGTYKELVSAICHRTTPTI